MPKGEEGENEDKIKIKLETLEMHRSAVSGKAGQPRGVPCGDGTIRTPPNHQRNTARGLRSSEAIERRRKQRSIKRNIARAEKRRQNGVRAAAQEPQQNRQTPKRKVMFRLKRQIKAGTLNVRGTKRAEARPEVEDWMTDMRIEILGITETHEPDVKTIKNKQKHMVLLRE